MLITNEDLNDLMKFKIGDIIEIADNHGGWFSPGDRFEVINNQSVKSFKNGELYEFKYLVNERFEKVKQYEQITFETAIRRMANEEETYIKYKGEYLKCMFTKSLNNLKERAIMIKFDNYIIETIMGIAEALDYEFCVLM